MMWTYVGVIVFMALQFLGGVFLRQPGLERVAALIEPFGGGAFRLATLYWTAAERNTLTPPLAGYLLANRLLWTAWPWRSWPPAYWLFDARKADGAVGRRDKGGADAGARPTTVRPPRFDRISRWTQLWVRARLDAQQVFLSPAYLVLVGLAAVLALVNLWYAPTTASMAARSIRSPGR
jgi:ABC-2 type transport system permease protein